MKKALGGTDLSVAANGNGRRGTGDDPTGKPGKAEKSKRLTDAQILKHQMEGAEELAKAQIELNKYTDDLLKKNAAVTESYRDMLDPMRVLNREIEKINQSMLTEDEKIDAIAAVSDKWIKAHGDMANASKELTMEQKAAEIVMNNFSSALMNLAVGGEFSFKKFVARMEAFKKSFASGGGGWGSVWGNIIGAVAGAKADGGPVAGGSTYLVGERGPELFTPGSSGSITPNHALGGGGMSIGSINITIQGGETNEETAGVMQKKLVETMKKVADGQIANSRRPGGLLYS
jgi:hypothetical protein